MAAEQEQPCLVFFSDGGKGLLDGVDLEEYEGVEGVVGSYIGLLKEVLQQVCNQKEYKHVKFMETTSPLQADFTSPLAIALATQQLGPDGSVVGFSNVGKALDLQGLLTAARGLPPPLNEKLGMEAVAQEGEEEEPEEGEEEQPQAMALAIFDEALARKVTSVEKRIGDMPSRFQGTFDEEQETVLVQALMAKVPVPDHEDEAALQPIHPMDLLTVLVSFMGEFAGSPPAANRPGLRSLVRGLTSRGGKLLSAMAVRTHVLQSAVWRIEDLAVGGAKLALRVAKKSLRPVLILYVVNRSLRTIEASNTPAMKMAKMSPKDAYEYYMKTNLGDDWQQLVEKDLLDAIKDVNDGYVTDDYKQEKRQLTAAMLRRLEVEEWDKERMKHFYYGSYGLGPWYFDMEERLHNPYFMGGRAWNGPIEGWVGKNKTYRDLEPTAVDFDAYALNRIEAAKGVSLTPQQRMRIVAKQQAQPVDSLLTSSLLDGVVEPTKVRQHVSQQ